MSNSALSMHLPFHLRFYPKTRAIQLKPADDKYIHFSLLWGSKEHISVDQMTDMYERVVEYFEAHDWKLTFKLIIARPSCCYGRFDAEFEDLLFQLRREYPALETKKNLPWEQHVGVLEPEDRPIAFHIAHSASRVMPELNAFLKSARPGCGKTLRMDVTVR